jgi:hypothetical protein
VPQELRPNVAFTALALFNVMRFPLLFLPMIINFIIESRSGTALSPPSPPNPPHLHIESRFLPHPRPSKTRPFPCSFPPSHKQFNRFPRLHASREAL